MSRRRDRRRALSQMNVVPYIDVMLVLLIIFMITAPLLAQGVHVDLPRAAAEPISPDDIDDPHTLVVTVDEQGAFYLSTAPDPERALDADTLRAGARQALDERAERLVLVRGDNRVPYGRVVEAMVLLQQAGAPSVGLVTDRPEAER